IDGDVHFAVRLAKLLGHPLASLQDAATGPGIEGLTRGQVFQEGVLVADFFGGIHALIIAKRSQKIKKEPTPQDYFAFATYSASISICLKKSCSSQPIGLLKKQARCLSTPTSPRRWASSVNRTMSSNNGAASSESQPCQRNCRIILVPRKPWKWMWS